MLQSISTLVIAPGTGGGCTPYNGLYREVLVENFAWYPLARTHFLRARNDSEIKSSYFQNFLNIDDNTELIQGFPKTEIFLDFSFLTRYFSLNMRQVIFREQLSIKSSRAPMTSLTMKKYEIMCRETKSTFARPCHLSPSNH